jgi:CHAD domain-containing protein
MAQGARVLGVDPENSVRANAALIIPVRVAELVAWERFIGDPERVGELHQMRIAAKRLRYTMEMFAVCYGAEFAQAVDRVKWIQEQLGDIHDADVLVPELQERAARVLAPSKSKRLTGVYSGDFDAAAGLVALCRLKRADRETTYRKFLEGWRDLRTEGFFESLRRLLWAGSEPAGGCGAESVSGRQDVRPGGKGSTDGATA